VDRTDVPFQDVIAEYLRRIAYAPDGYARLIRLPA
jgi:hypothetical protein